MFAEPVPSRVTFCPLVSLPILRLEFPVKVVLEMVVASEN
jgi:hypothetical protein